MAFWSCESFSRARSRSSSAGAATAGEGALCPLGVSAAGRVGVVASIGYLAFLGGPPTIGFLGNQVTVLHALSAVAIVLVVSILLAGALQPRPSAADEPADRTQARRSS